MPIAEIEFLQRDPNAKYKEGLKPEEAAELAEIDTRLKALHEERFQLTNKRRIITNRALVRVQKAAGKRRVKTRNGRPVRT